MYIGVFGIALFGNFKPPYSINFIRITIITWGLKLISCQLLPLLQVEFYTMKCVIFTAEVEP